jgi:hypothetical protein
MPEKDPNKRFSTTTRTNRSYDDWIGLLSRNLRECLLWYSQGVKNFPSYYMRIHLEGLEVDVHVCFNRPFVIIGGAMSGMKEELRVIILDKGKSHGWRIIL